MSGEFTTLQRLMDGYWHDEEYFDNRYDAEVVRDVFIGTSASTHWRVIVRTPFASVTEFAESGSDRAKMYNRLSDPEWSEYLRLQEKFK